MIQPPDSRQQHRQPVPTRTRISIRDQLEQLAQANHPGLAKRLSNSKSCRRAPQRQSRWQERILLALCAVLVTLFVIRTEFAIADEPQWGLKLRHGSNEYMQLALDTDIQIDITGLVARVMVTQTFSNPGAQWATGTYHFPLPQGAAVDKLHIKVGERILEGEIQETRTARRIYQQARESGKTATLVEQQRRNQFETRLVNIGPGEAIEISIGYLQNISYKDASYHLRIPMTFTPRWHAEPTIIQAARSAGRQAISDRLEQPPEPRLQAATTTGGHTLKLHANLSSAIAYAAIESRYDDVDIRRVDSGYQIDLLDPQARTDHDFELSWTPALQIAPSASLTTFNDGQDTYAQLMLVPPLGSAITRRAREVVLIIDTSGSMAGTSIRQARTALTGALAALGPDDYFNLLQFNSRTQALFAHSVPATPTSLYMARNFISGLRANGGTNMSPALQKAFATAEIPGLMRQVVFITDGAVNNEADLLKQVAEQLGHSRLFTVAIGPAPNSWFMRKAAEIGRGSYIYIGKLAEVETQISALWRRIQLPALTDICVNWGSTAEYYPEVIPDLYAGEPLWLIARLPTEPTMIGLCGRFNGQDWQLNVNGYDINNRSFNAQGDLDQLSVRGNSTGETLPVLWARKKIEALEDSLLFGADRELTVLQITSLALDFGLLTRHTGLVAVDKTPRRGSAEPLAQTDLPGLLPAGTSTQLANYPATATGWLSQVLLSLLVLLLSSTLLWFSSKRLPMTNHTANTGL